jgi:hypothetical protein
MVLHDIKLTNGKASMKKFILTFTLTALTAWQASADNWAIGAGVASYNYNGTPNISGVPLTSSGTAPWVPSAVFSGYEALTPSGNEAGPGYDQWFPLGYLNFVAKITDTFFAPVAGSYSFGTFSDDGSALYIDGNLVVNNGGEHGPISAFSSVYLTAGAHALYVDYYEGLPLIQANLTVYRQSIPDGGTTLALFGLALVGLTGLRRSI